jgi:Uma2 family endonuclease
MNVQANLRMDKTAFLAWAQANEERYELAGGRVVMMTGVSLRHAMIVASLLSLLRNQLDLKEWTVVAEFGLDAGPDTLRYPDIMVQRLPSNTRVYTTTEPVIIIEVLSPSTATIDLGDKAAEYLRIPSLLAYIVLSLDEPKAWTYARTDAGSTAGPGIIAGPEAVISIAALHLNLPMGDIYAGVELGDPNQTP